MALVYAIIATIFLGFGTFMSRAIVIRLPAFQIIGPLFLINASFIVPIALVRNEWHQLALSEYLEIILIGALTSLGGFLFFSIVKRANASSGIIGQAISPAMVLFIAPFILSTKIVFLQLIVVITLIFAVVYPVRNMVTGLSSSATIILMLAQGFNAALISILITHISQAGVEITQTLIIQQVVAGLILTPRFWPKGIKLSDYPNLARRSFFMSMGWFFSFLAFGTGKTIIIQSILSGVPLTILFIESLAYRKRPAIAMIFSSAVIIFCITILNLIT